MAQKRPILCPDLPTIHLLKFESAFEVILLVILNSNYWLCFIIIFYLYDSKISFIYTILFLFRFLVLVVTSSHPVMASLFFSQHNGVVLPSMFLFFLGVSSLPMSVTTHLDCCSHQNYFAERSYCRHIPPLVSLLLDSSYAVATMPSMATNLAATPHLYTLFFPLAAHSSKIGLDR